MRRAGTITRVLPALLTLALAAGIPATAASAATAGTTAKRTRAIPPPPSKSGSKPAYSARLLQCRRSPQTASRTATVSAVMRPTAAGRRLSLRVALYQRPLGGGRWALRADVPGLSEWTSPSDSSIGSRAADVYRYRQAVGRLAVPYAYRFRVTFRWSDANGRPVAEAVVNTATCREPDLRPDLVLTRAVADPLLPGQTSARYIVTVRNVGRAAATGVQVAATFSSPTRTVRKLAPSESADLVFWGPPCGGAEPAPSFLADPSNLIDEARETNNSLVATCPATLDGP
ncbi:CARDB domain-containing protein [Conexibacter arvalis]|uniref:Putative repeat protein (TIGR01451 family) n=1 Tax=Conexibacter arvalis TaxID=912552 RepID=A0A840IJ77_9ACTN|nr:CARDB domain-containing protein [Conexibacter arvalis]MBB4664395.1 putative repeat protein (TIGR01451 family) [Conexibacter arvalis]